MVPTFKSYCSHLIRGRVVCFFVFLGGSYLGDRSRNGIHVGFDKMFVFCDKYCVCSDKCMSIIIKIKYVNFDNMSDICNKFYFTTIYKYFIITDTIYQKIHIYYNF